MSSTWSAALQAEAAAAREAEASQRAEQAAQDAAEVRELAQREAAAHDSALQEASKKAARLARLEGAGTTWCSIVLMRGIWPSHLLIQHVRLQRLHHIVVLSC